MGKPHQLPIAVTRVMRPQLHCFTSLGHECNCIQTYSRLETQPSELTGSLRVSTSDGAPYTSHGVQRALKGSSNPYRNHPFRPGKIPAPTPPPLMCRHRDPHSPKHNSRAPHDKHRGRNCNISPGSKVVASYRDGIRESFIVYL